MSNELFFRLCEFQFSFIELFKKVVDAKTYPDENKRRVYGYMAEILYGIFICKLEEENRKILRLQLVQFKNTKQLTIFTGIKSVFCQLCIFLFPYA